MITGLSTEATVEVYVRSSRYGNPLNEQIEQLYRIVENGYVEDVTVHSWPTHVTLDSRACDDAVIATFEEFAKWANMHGVSVYPPFEVRQRRSQITGESRDELVLPTLCMAVYDRSGSNPFPPLVGRGYLHSRESARRASRDRTAVTDRGERLAGATRWSGGLGQLRSTLLTG